MKLLCCISWLLKTKETHDGNSAYGNSIMNTLVMDIMDWIREKEIVHWNNIQSDLFSFYQLNECNEGASISKNSIVCNFIQVKYAVVVLFFPWNGFSLPCISQPFYIRKFNFIHILLHAMLLNNAQANFLQIITIISSTLWVFI